MQFIKAVDKEYGDDGTPVPKERNWEAAIASKVSAG